MIPFDNGSIHITTVEKSMYTDMEDGQYGYASVKDMMIQKKVG